MDHTTTCLQLQVSVCVRTSGAHEVEDHTRNTALTCLYRLSLMFLSAVIGIAADCAMIAGACHSTYNGGEHATVAC